MSEKTELEAFLKKLKKDPQIRHEDLNFDVVLIRTRNATGPETVHARVCDKAWGPNISRRLEFLSVKELLKQVRSGKFCRLCVDSMAPYFTVSNHKLFRGNYADYWELVERLREARLTLRENIHTATLSEAVTSLDLLREVAFHSASNSGLSSFLPGGMDELAEYMKVIKERVQKDEGRKELLRLLSDLAAARNNLFDSEKDPSNQASGEGRLSNLSALPGAQEMEERVRSIRREYLENSRVWVIVRLEAENERDLTPYWELARWAWPNFGSSVTLPLGAYLYFAQMQPEAIKEVSKGHESIEMPSLQELEVVEALQKDNPLLPFDERYETAKLL